MKRLIVCDTLYQIMLAIQMQDTLFKYDEVDIWISDHSSGNNIIANNLIKINVFNKVEYIKNKDIIYSNSLLKKIYNLFFYGFGLNNRNIEAYDEVIFYSMSIMIYGLSNYYQKIKHNVLWSRFEEGILSYETDFSNGKSVYVLEKLFDFLRKEKVRDNIKNYYCVFPNLKINNMDWSLIRIPGINENKEKMTNILKKIFVINDFKIKEKYIYFASSSDIDNHPCGETELILKISKYVGKENLIVKKHPRDTRDVFVQNGIKEFKENGIPWEIYQLCYDYSDKILLTIDSGAFLSISAMQKNNNIKGFFLYPIVKEKREKYNNFIDRDLIISNILKKLHEINECMNIDKIVDLNTIGRK